MHYYNNNNKNKMKLMKNYNHKIQNLKLINVEYVYLKMHHFLIHYLVHVNVIYIYNLYNRYWFNEICTFTLFINMDIIINKN